MRNYIDSREGASGCLESLHGAGGGGVTDGECGQRIFIFYKDVKDRIRVREGRG